MTRGPLRLRSRTVFAVAAVLTLLASGFPRAYSWRVFAAALILAFVVRLAYVALRWRARRPLFSGWIFVIALVLLFTAIARQHLAE